MSCLAYYNSVQTRTILIGLIAATALLCLTTIDLWSASRSAATANSQSEALEQLIKVNESEITVGEEQIVEERQQVIVEENQLRATMEEINANRSHKVVIQAAPTIRPTPSTPSGEPIVIANSDGATWVTSYATLLAALGTAAAGGAAVAVAIRNRSKKGSKSKPHGPTASVSRRATASRSARQHSASPNAAGRRSRSPESSE
jgi:hypothetical protein